MEDNQSPAPTQSSNPMMMILMIIFVLLIVGGGIYYATTRNKAADQSTATTDQSTQNQTGETMQKDESTATADGETMTEGAVKKFTVTGSNFSFDPKEMTVKKGDKVKVTFKNADGFHDWVLDEFNVKTKQIKGGEEETVEFIADKAGTFEYYCSVGQHRANGMSGKFIVEE